MTWFKVDDGLHAHKKAARAGVHAMGLWVLAGSWCADQLTDGFIPDYMAARLDRDFEDNAERLVEAGLWAAADKDGDKGWQFHDWTERQPTREEAQIAAARKSSGGKLGNHRRWHVNGKADPRCPFCEMPPSDNRSDKRSEDRSVVGIATESPDPARPDPTRPEVLPTEELPQKTSSSSGRKTAAPTKHPLPANFAITDEMRSWAKEHAPSVDLGTAAIRFANYWADKHENGVKDAVKSELGWKRAWQNWLLADIKFERQKATSQPTHRPAFTGETRHTNQRHDNPFRPGAGPQDYPKAGK